MGVAKIDENSRASLTGVSSVDGKTVIPIYADPTTHRLLIDTAGSSGLILGTSTITGTGQANGQLLYDNNGVVGELLVATYPSLTELSYVKGVTSAIQTQLNGKQASGTYLTSTTGITVDQTVGQTIGATGARLTKLWATDITVTNAITGSVTGNAGTVTNATLTTALTVNTGTVTLTGNVANTSVLTIGAGAVSVSGSNTGDNATNSTYATLATTISTANTWSAVQTIPQVINTPATVTVTSNAGTVAITSKINNFTNSSAATMAITMAVTSAVDGQLSMVRIYDASGVAQTIGWTNTENSTVSVPTTSNGSTTLPLTVGFQFNGATSKWRCIGLA